MPHAKRVRVPVVWSPQWEGPIEGWTRAFILGQRWRCDIIDEFDDLLQDGWTVFNKLSLRYPRVIEPRHFMALYKVAYANLIHDKSAYLQRKRRCHDELPQDVSEYSGMSVGETMNAGYLSALLSEAPQELKLAMALMAQDPQALHAEVTPKEPRENLNMKLRRILGLTNTFDFKGAMLDLLFN